MKDAIIREWKEKDLAIYREYQLGEYEWQKYDGPYFPSPTEEDIEKSIQKIKLHIKDPVNNPHSMRVIADKDSDTMIGSVNHYYECRETNWISLGISIFDKSYWRSGIGTTIFKQWTDMIFKKFPEIVRLGFYTWSGNVGMMKIGDKLGYKLETRVRKARIVDGEYYDSIGYGVLRDEWNSYL